MGCRGTGVLPSAVASSLSRERLISMKPSDFILPLIAMVWASGNVFMTMMKELNDKRDRILLGRNGDRSMSTEHRRLLLMNDWVPLTLIAVVFTLAVGVMALIMPFQMELQDRSTALWLICGVVAFMSACCS